MYLKTQDRRSETAATAGFFRGFIAGGLLVGTLRRGICHSHLGFRNPKSRSNGESTYRNMSMFLIGLELNQRNSEKN
jgi:hypothetical protein